MSVAVVVHTLVAAEATAGVAAVVSTVAASRAAVASFGEGVEEVVAIAAPLRTTAYQIGLNWLQRRGIELDLSGDELAAISEEVMEMFASLDDVHRFLVHDIRFHRAVAAAARNPLLAAIMEMVADLFYEERRTTVDRWRGAPEAAEQHRRIYQAIKSGDVDRARREMGKHLTWAQRDQEDE